MGEVGAEQGNEHQVSETTKSSTPESPLDRIAFAVTVGAAVLTGIFTLWSNADIGGSGFAESAASVLVIITAVGGVAMGVLYVRRRLF